MNPLTIFAIGLLTIGVFFLGIYAGEQNIIRKERSSHLYRSQDDSDVWWIMGAVAIVAAIVIGVVAVNPAEKEIERARQLGSPMIDTR